MRNLYWRSEFLRRWVTANAVGELIGLGAVAAAGYGLARTFGEGKSTVAIVAMALAFVLLGGVEGYIVGLSQQRVLERYLPQATGWTRATIIGAMVAWVLGMLPSTMMSLVSTTAAGAPAPMSMPVRSALAALLGALAGPLLAFFQWRCLRTKIARGSLWWLPANSLAWAGAMPIIFAAAHAAAAATSPALATVIVGIGLAGAGAAAGLVHGCALIPLLERDMDRRNRPTPADAG